MLLQWKKRAWFIPGGFISLAALPWLLLLSVAPKGATGIELNELPDDFYRQVVVPPPATITLDGTHTMGEFIDVCRSISRNTDSSSVYRVRIPDVQRYGDLITLLDAVQTNDLSFYRSGHLITMWRQRSQGDHHPLSYYSDIVPFPNGFSNDVVIGRPSVWDELFSQPWRVLLQDSVLWTTIIVLSGWTVLCLISLRDALLTVNERSFREMNDSGLH